MLSRNSQMRPFRIRRNIEQLLLISKYTLLRKLKLIMFLFPERSKDRQKVNFSAMMGHDTFQ